MTIAQSLFRIGQILFLAFFYVGSLFGAYGVGYYHGHSEGYFQIGEDYREIYRSYRPKPTSESDKIP